MVFELAGARILAPGIGSSTYVWTSVIGIIIAALSVGYWVGGKIADKRGYMIDIARLSLLTALTITLTIIQYGGVLGWVATNFDDPRLQGVIASLILFAPTSFLLGTISPYLAKLKVRSLKKTGRSIASLSALNSIGGIIGTFVAGFVLFSYVGSRETLVLTAVAMVAVSWLAAPRVEWKLRVVISAGILLINAVPVPKADAITIDTPSAHYVIYEAEGRRLLATGPYAAQSAISLNDPEKLAFWYTKQLAEVVNRSPEHRDILILGGGAFTLPQYLAKKYPSSQIDVVEIDPDLVGIARRYFNYQDPSNVRIISADARAYVNQTDKTYDVVVVDVYGDAHVPFTFLTREYGDQINRIVRPHGVVGANVIGNTRGECLEFVRSLDAPYRMHFAYSAYAIEHSKKPRSNMVVTYSRQPFTWPGAQPLVLQKTVLYSDNYAPAERLQHGCSRT